MFDKFPFSHNDLHKQIIYNQFIHAIPLPSSSNPFSDQNPIVLLLIGKMLETFQTQAHILFLIFSCWQVGNH